MAQPINQPMNKGELFIVEQCYKDPIIKEIISTLKKKEGLTYAEANGILRDVALVLEYESNYLAKLPI